MDSPVTRDDRIAALACLDQPLRRQIYELLAARADWTSRDTAAEELDLSRSVAAFHLDKLADAGVLEVSFERTTGRSGPGAGRPSKVYRLVAPEISASMPERHYDLAGRLLADAIAESSATGEPAQECLDRTARATGESLGVAERSRVDPELRDVLAPLADSGYEPVVIGDEEIALKNCPFHLLAEAHRAMVCGMNLNLLSGLLDGLEPTLRLEAHLEPQPGYCCVRLRRS